MPDSTKRILTDETGQSIVSALQGLIEVVDPNGTATAAAEKINGLTIAVNSLSAGAAPTASLTTVNDHYHLALSIPIELPTVSSSNNGQIITVENGVYTIAEAPTGLPAITAVDDGKILQADNGGWVAADSLPTQMVGATSEANGISGLVPAPTTNDADKFLSGDGTYKSGGLPMVILSYGNSTWQDFINAYRNNVIVYCRASSQSNPASGAQTRMGFMAYVNQQDNPTEVEFQYYRSMNPTNKSINQMSDQVFVYKLTSSGSWTVTSREAGIKKVEVNSNSEGTVAFDKTTATLTINSGLPKVTSADEGKILKVVNGVWTAVNPE